MLPKIDMLSLPQKLGTFHKNFRRCQKSPQIRSVLIDLSRDINILDHLFLRYSNYFSCAGKKYVIKRFCEIHSLFNNSYEPRYLLNQLYITDFIIWLQTSPESRLEELQPILDDVSFLKNLYTFMHKQNICISRALYLNFSLLYKDSS